MSGLESLVIDINPSDSKSILNLDSNKPPISSSNFGSGIELLMNDKKKATSGAGTSDIGIGELSELENELNNLADDVKDKTFDSVLEKSKPSIINNVSDSLNVKFDDIKINKDSDLGRKTADAYQDSKTWDGYGKFSSVPVQSEPQLSRDELVREKFKYLRRLEDLENKGATLTKKYNMESPLSEMQGEYEMILAEKEKSNSVKFQGRMLMAAITGLEFLNNKFDPFDLNMDGWAEQVNENITDYDEIFAELHEKYKSKAKMAPELKLLFQLGGSAIMVHMTNTMFKSAIPGMDDILKQNPELMQQFSQAAVNSMGDNNPGFGNFMNNFMPGNTGSSGGNNNSGAPPPVSNIGAPPPSINTQTLKSQRSGQPQNRPDLMASRANAGISIEEKFSNIGDNNSIRMAPQKSTRPEMRGPSDINDLLSGLKPKQGPGPPPPIPPPQREKSEKNSSTISIQDLKEISNQKVPKSNKKGKPSREKTTISLDL